MMKMYIVKCQGRGSVKCLWIVFYILKKPYQDFDEKGHKFCYKHVIYLYKVTVDAYFLLLIYNVIVNLHFCAIDNSSVFVSEMDL